VTTIDTIEPAPTTDQLLLRDSTARYITSVCPLPEVRRLVDDPVGVKPGYLEQASELGWFAMLIPEQYGGGSVSGNGLVDAAFIADQRGRGLQPGAFVPTNAVAFALAANGSEQHRADVLPSLANGTAIATWALADWTANWTPGGAVLAERTGGGFALSGVAGLVQDAHIARWILVTASAGTGLAQFIVETATPGITVSPLKTLDLTKRLCEVRFDGVFLGETALVGSFDNAAGDVERALQVALVLQLAESVGAMDHLFEMTRQYSIDRIAFGRPIGSFQALKHLLADTSLLLETTKAGLSDAIVAVQRDRSDAGEVVSMVKSFAAETGVTLAQNCLQVHGGVGFTWEHDLHLYLRRLTSDASLFGDAIWHRRRICQLHGVEGNQ
jgi:alkylation response protein AidB-like acyl-CoA dehydrogenase